MKPVRDSGRTAKVMRDGSVALTAGSENVSSNITLASGVVGVALIERFALAEPPRTRLCRLSSIHMSAADLSVSPMRFIGMVGHILSAGERDRTLGTVSGRIAYA